MNAYTKLREEIERVKPLAYLANIGDPRFAGERVELYLTQAEDLLALVEELDEHFEWLQELGAMRVLAALKKVIGE